MNDRDGQPENNSSGSSGQFRKLTATCASQCTCTKSSKAFWDYLATKWQVFPTGLKGQTTFPTWPVKVWPMATKFGCWDIEGPNSLPEHQKFVATRVITTDSTGHNHAESSTRNQIQFWTMHMNVKLHDGSSTISLETIQNP